MFSVPTGMNVCKLIVLLESIISLTRAWKWEMSLALSLWSLTDLQVPPSSLPFEEPSISACKPIVLSAAHSQNVCILCLIFVGGVEVTQRVNAAWMLRKIYNGGKKDRNVWVSVGGLSTNKSFSICPRVQSQQQNKYMAKVQGIFCPFSSSSHCCLSQLCLGSKLKVIMNAECILVTEK